MPLNIGGIGILILLLPGYENKKNREFSLQVSKSIMFMHLFYEKLSTCPRQISSMYKIMKQVQ
jgi:hypothetical protein